MIASALRQGDIGPRGPFQVAQKIYLLETIMPTATHLRGAIPSPPSFIAAAPVFQTVVGAPPNTITIPAQLSMWGNDTYGDCVTAEEAFAKACSNPEIFIPQSTVISWATAHNVLNGATLSGVLQTMQSDGFQQNGNIYDDGGYARVMYTNSGNLMSAIAVGPVKLGIAADQIDTAWSSTNGKSGWFATGFHTDTAEDHCVALCGYGSISWLASQLKVAVPAGVDGSKPGYALYTWDSIGIIDEPSMVAITQEAWLRTPTTVVKPSGTGFTGKVTLSQTSQESPALASTTTFLHLAWSGVGNKELNILCSGNGQTFGTKFTSTETSSDAPALCGHNGILIIGWKGNGNDDLNVAHVTLNATSATGLTNKVTLGETSPVRPALASFNGRLYIAWKGDGNDQLNIMSSGDNGATFGGKYTSPETSPQAPSLSVDGGNLLISWKGDGNDSMNVARVLVNGANVTGFGNKVTLGDTTPVSTAIAANGNKLYLAWKGDGNNNLNVESSTDGGATFSGKFTSTETSMLAPALTTANGKMYIAWTGVSNDELNIAVVP
jgi:hypothetical protein